MKALILNSGIGSRIRNVTTSDIPKCLVRLNNEYTILGRQLEYLNKFNINDVVITTGYLSDKIVSYCNELDLDINFSFVFNDKYNTTNYIYSIYLSREYLIDNDIILMHGDLVFSDNVLASVLNSNNSCMTISSSSPVIEKDFKVELINNRINKISVNIFNNVFMGEPLYKINKSDWNIWLEEICNFCENGTTNVYAEEAFNSVSHICNITALDIKDQFCMEIDDENDLDLACSYLNNC